MNQSVSKFFIPCFFNSPPLEPASAARALDGKFSFTAGAIPAFVTAMPRKRSRRGRKSASVNPLKAVLATCAILLVLLVVALLLVKSAIQGWLRGDEFREWLVAKARVVLSSDIELAELKWQGSEVYADRFVASGYEDAAFSRLLLEAVRVKAGGVEAGAFQVADATVNRFDLEFSPDRKKRRAGDAPAGGGEATGPGSPGPSIPEWLRRHLPNRVEVDQVVVSSARVAVKKPDGSSPFTLTGAKATIEPDFRTGMWEVRGSGGRLLVPDQPEIRLKELGMRWRGSDLFIDRCSLGIYEKGHVDGAGEISFEGDGSFDLDLEISTFDIDDLVDEVWRERLTGTIGGPVKITGRPGAFVYEGDIAVTDGRIESLPVLSLIANYTRNERFKHLVLDEARTSFRSEGDRVELTDLRLQSDGLVRVEGGLVVEGEALAGNFRVGVAPGTLRWIPGAERKVFVEEKDGFLWAPMTVAGTMGEPKEDLSGRLVAAAGEAILQDLPAGVLEEAEKLLGTEGASESATGTLLETGKPLLDLITPFLK